MSELPIIEQEEMTKFMIDEVNSEAGIKSRDDLSACGAEGVAFMKWVVRECIKSSRVMSTWKEARTVLLHKNGNREEIGTWRLISITNCMYRIFAYLMARAIHDVNTRVQVLSDSQKSFIKKTNGCSEHEIILNELMHDASRTRKSLIVTAIDFTSAFGSVPSELTMPVMRQRNFPERTQQTVASLYEGTHR
jgi:hypothetical protein